MWSDDNYSLLHLRMRMRMLNSNWGGNAKGCAEWVQSA
jgi:hypothetical protein